MKSASEFAVLLIKDIAGKEMDHSPYFIVNKYVAGQLNGLIEVDLN